MKVYKNFKYEPTITQSSSSCQEVLFLSLNNSEITILNLISEIDNKYGRGNCYINQTTIAEITGLSREQVNRIIAKLCRYRLISKIYRHMRSCIYELSMFLYDPIIRTKYRHKMRAFRYLSVIMLYASLFISNITRTTQDIRNLYKTVIDNQELDRDSICKRVKRSPRRMYSSEARSQFILKLTKEFNLTKKGQVEFTPYPLDALQYAHEKFLLADQSKLTSPFSFLLSWCQVWCSENQVVADHGTKNQLLNEYQIPQWMPNQSDRQLEPKLTEKEKIESDKKFEEQHTSFMKLQDTNKPVSRFSKANKYQQREGSYQSREWKGYDRSLRFEPMSEIRARKALKNGDYESYSRCTKEPDWTNPRVVERVHQMTKAFYHTPEEIERLRQELGRSDRTPRGLNEILSNMSAVIAPVEEPKKDQPRSTKSNLREYLAKYASPDIPRPKEYQYVKPEE